MTSTQITPSKSPRENVPVVALASALACAAAASLLAWTFLPDRKRRASLAGQVSLAVLATFAATIVWQQRQKEADAARHLLSHLHEVRDTRWLKKHPVAYG
jgi:uncharacterized membrane protein YqjE